jgi:TolB-like protein
MHCKFSRPHHFGGIVRPEFGLDPTMRGLFEELKHRNVFRVGIAYIIAGWLIAQVADLAGDAFGAPAWVMQMLIVVLLAGLPVALFLAWAYELTPEGVKKAKDLPADMPKDPRSGRMLNGLTMVALIIAVAWLGWDKFQGPTTTETIGEKSIAVLPFADFSPGGDYAWFADGLTDEILNALARTRDLRVASRTSSFAYKGSDLGAPTIGAELGVAHILEGSVRRAGDRVRVTAQLIRTSDDVHLWSDTFDGDSKDSIDIQERIAFRIASLLDTAMNPEELKRMVAAGTDSIAAWEAYLQMSDLFAASLDDVDRSRGNDILALYDQIVGWDPRFGEAHALMARIFFTWMDNSDTRNPPEGFPLDTLPARLNEVALLAAENARNEGSRLDVELIRNQAQVRISDQVDVAAALVSLRPYDTVAWNNYIASLTAASRFDEARAAITDIPPETLDGDSAFLLAASVVRIDLADGLAMARRGLAKTSPSAGALYQAHRIFLYAGLVDEAAETARRFLALRSDPGLPNLLQLRQACAEGRVADADALYEGSKAAGSYSNALMQWLSLRILGRDDEALDLLRPLDTSATLYQLSRLLTYTHFDPRPYPNLSKVLVAQGVQRETIIPIPYACRR